MTAKEPQGPVWKRVSPQIWIFVGTVAVIVVIDQITKFLAIGGLTTAFESVTGEPVGFGDKLSAFLWQKHPVRADAVTVIENFWHFKYIENPGAAWGFLSGSAGWFRTPFFLLVSVAAMVFIVYYFRKTTPEQRWLRLALSLVFGGAVGNFLDRVRLGYVIDFIDWHWFDKATWPTFNIADSGITVGVTLMILEMMFTRRAKADEIKGKGA
jgi:signal peptidase II